MFFPCFGLWKIFHGKLYTNLNLEEHFLAINSVEKCLLFLYSNIFCRTLLRHSSYLLEQQGVINGLADVIKHVEHLVVHCSLHVSAVLLGALDEVRQVELQVGHPTCGSYQLVVEHQLGLCVLSDLLEVAVMLLDEEHALFDVAGIV